MATYPTPPGDRIPYDRDGSTVVSMGGSFSGTPSPYTTGQMQAINSESFTGGLPGAGTPSWAIIFSQKWDLNGYFLDTNDGDHTGIMQWSPDSTDGQSGTWNTLVNPYLDNWNNPNVPTYRSSIHTLATNGVQAVRWTTTGGSGVILRGVHFYGVPTVVGSSSATSNQLFAWHPTLNQPMALTPADWQDMGRGNILTKQFRIKNNSLLTANSVTLAEEALTDATPSLVGTSGQFLFSSDNISFSDTLSLGNIAASAITPIIYWRDSVDAGAALGVWALRAVATASSFS